MIACPICGRRTSVTETRMAGTNVRRRRRCGCGHRVTTVEIVIPDRASHRPVVDLVTVPRHEIEAIRDAAVRALGVAVPVAAPDPEPGATR